MSLFSKLLIDTPSFLSLLVSDLLGLVTNEHLLFHLRKLLKELLLLGFGLLLGVFLLLELFNKLLLLLSLHFGIVLNRLALSLSLHLDFFLLSGEALLKFTHLLGVFDYLSPSLTALDSTMNLHDRFRGLSLIQSVELLP